MLSGSLPQGVSYYIRKKQEEKNSESSPAALLGWSVHNMKNQ
jgi:hypothetical protein